jgi:hypothetical protein
MDRREFNAPHAAPMRGRSGEIMERAELARSSSRAEWLVVVGTILTMVLSSVCVVVLCAAANYASDTAAKVTYVAPAASATSGLGASTDVVGGADAAVIGLR